MNRLMLSALAAVLALGLFGLMPVLSQDMGGEPEAKEPTPAAAEQSPQQKVLASLAGEFDVETKMWMAPGEPTIMKSTNTRSLVLGGNYLREPYTVKAGDYQHEGELTWCYNPKTKKLQMTHLISVSPGMEVLETDWDGKAKIVEFKFKAVYDGQDYDSRYVMNWESADKQVLEVRSSRIEKDGTRAAEIKEVEVTYTRKAGKKNG